MKDVLELVEEYNIPLVKINPIRKYWLIRTQRDDYFEEFHLKSFIGIGMNEFNDPTDFLEEKKNHTTRKLQYEYDAVNTEKLFTQIKTFFHDIKIGDVVMIPIKNFNFIVFGEVTSSVYFEEISERMILQGDCPFIKRRTVRWIKCHEREGLDPFLYNMLQNHATISNVDDFADAIDRTLHSFYYKGDRAHLILKVKQQKDIPLVDLLDALQSPLDLVEYLKNVKNPDVDFHKRDLDAKLRVQSPGVIEFISSGGVFGLAIFLGVFMVFLVGGKFNFNITKEKATGEIETDGILGKILKIKQLDQNNELKRDLIKTSEDDLDRLTHAQQQLQRAVETLEIEMPEEFLMDNDNKIGRTKDEIPVKKQESN